VAVVVVQVQSVEMLLVALLVLVVLVFQPIHLGAKQHPLVKM
jgi:hypothetical protein